MAPEKMAALIAAESSAPAWYEVDMFLQEGVMEKVQRGRDITAQIKELEQELKDLKPELEAYLMGSGSDKIDIEDGVTIKLGRGTSPSKLDKVRLVEKGVSVELLAECTTEGKPYTFVQYTFPKPSKEGK